MRGKPGRHAPAFVLLALANGPSYGLGLLNHLKENMPYCPLDTAAVYRALTTLEANGFVTSTEEPNEIRKYYTITSEGYKELQRYQKDILIRLSNLNYFIKEFDKLDKKYRLPESL